MKIHFNLQDFLPRLRLVKSVVATSNRKQILQNVKIVADKRYFGAILQAADSEHGLRVRVDCDVVEDGSALLPVQGLIDILQSANEKRLELERIDEGTILKWDDEEYDTFLTESPDTFHDVPDFTEESYYEIPTEMMQTVIRRTIFAAAPAKDKMRHAMKGVCFEAREESIDAVASNGDRLAWQRASGKIIGNPIIESAIVSVKALKLLDRILKDKTFFHWEVVHMAVAEGLVLFQGEDFSMFALLPSQTYPQWRRHVPQTKEMACATVNCGELYTAMKSVQTATPKVSEPKVALTFERGKLTLEAQDKESKTMTLAVPLSFDGQATVRINPAHLTDMLAVLDFGSSLSIHLTGDQPVMVKTDDDFTYLTMPCRNDKGGLEIEIESTAKPEVAPESKAVRESKPIKAIAKQRMLPNFTAGRVVKW